MRLCYSVLFNTSILGSTIYFLGFIVFSLENIAGNCLVEIKYLVNFFSNLFCGLASVGGGGAMPEARFRRVSVAHEA